MKYSEFRKLMENKSLRVERIPGGNIRVSILDDNYWNVLAIVDIRKTESYNILPLSGYPRKLIRFVAQKCMELAFTNLEDREDEEKYYYKLNGIGGQRSFLNKLQYVDSFVISTFVDAESTQSTFTDSEFAALPDDIKSHNWKKIKVEREEKC